MLGALLGGGAAAIGLSFLGQQLILAPVFALAAYLIAAALPADLPGEAKAGPPRLSLPKGALLAVCIMPMGALMIEGAMMEWSALLLRDDLASGPLAAGVVLAAFLLVMALGRITGDRITEQLGPGRVLVGSCILAGVGSVMFAMAPGVGVAFAGAMVMGAGAANIYPLAMSRASQVPGRSAEDNIAAVAFAAFSVFLLGPPLIGSLGHFLGLPMALLVLTPAALYPLVMISTSLGIRSPHAQTEGPRP